MTYRVIEGFYDLQDPEGGSFHLYNKGDTYPREGLVPTQERIADLLGCGNARRSALIEEIEEIEETDETREEDLDTAPENTEEDQPARSGRSRSKKAG